MSKLEHIETKPYFAWFPVKTDKGWAWFEWVLVEINYAPEIYQGLLPTKKYYKL